MKLEIITPEEQVFNGDVTSVRFPGKNGEFEILQNHAPIISTLNKGEIRVITNSETKNFEINGGVIEMQDNRIIVLAE